MTEPYNLSAIGPWRTWPLALDRSAFDPKRTSPFRQRDFLCTIGSYSFGAEYAPT